MFSFPSRTLSKNKWKTAVLYIKEHVNFYRIHILYFTFMPLILSGVLYAGNGRYPLTFIDALFNSVSAFCVCGLATVEFSGLTPFQQFLLLVEMCIGNQIIVSWVMVYVRRRFFKKTFTHAIEQELARRVGAKLDINMNVKVIPWWKRIFYLLTGRSGDQRSTASSSSFRKSSPSRVRPGMIRRMNEAPRLINPSGWISEGQSPHSSTPGGQHAQHSNYGVAKETEAALDDLTREYGEHFEKPHEGSDRDKHEDSLKEEQQSSRLVHTSPGSFRNRTTSEYSVDSGRRQQKAPTLPRAQTIEFADTRSSEAISNERRRSGKPMPRNDSQRIGRVPTRDRGSMGRPTMSLPHSLAEAPPSAMRTKHRGFGGFPMPHEILSSLFRRMFPNLERRLTRTVTIPHTHTIVSHRDESVPPGARLVPYISFEAVVGRNSKFHQLTKEQLDELGGVEYRALTLLLWIVGVYFVLLPLIGFAIVAPYMSMSRWQEVFTPPSLLRPLSPVWFSFWQIISAFTNTGMSLHDDSMIPFQRAYPMIFVTVFLILAGNTAFPIFLRLIIWIMTRTVRKQTRLHETLHFLLDHPRRCFIYLFPSHQTWFLLTALVALLVTDWFFFLILDIRNQVIEAIPLGVRVLAGLMQASAVRAAGFAIVPLSALAPAVKVLFIIMMYISVYPIAMSVRATNVYEEKSLGIFEDAQSSLDEEKFDPNGPRATVYGRYLRMHMRKQLSFDMWWIALALFLVCIVERGNLTNPQNATWFNIFNIIFELVSGYGIVGLSLGVPYAKYSFCGGFKPLSKLIFCVAIIRGRHRGLPVAIDRAVMLPFQFKQDSTSEEPPSILPDDAFIHPEPHLERARDEEALSEKSQPQDSGERSRYNHRRGTSSIPGAQGIRDFRDYVPKRTATIDES